MRITLVCHASVIVEAGDVVVWSDPWLFGTAFNDSWALLPEPSPALVDDWLPRITHLYISHEHPDHFHLPSLRSLPDEFKKRVTVIFQMLHTDRMTSALRRLGFTNIVTMRHREFLRVSERTKLYMYQAAPLDSVLAVITGCTVLNVNDAELCDYDLKTIKKDLGTIETVLNQFSFATYDGREDYRRFAKAQARRVLQSVSGDHIALGAAATIPFASFMYFCSVDNAHLNDCGNRIRDVCAHFANRNLKMIVLCPGDSYAVGKAWNNDAAMEYYDSVGSSVLTSKPAISVKPEALEQAADKLLVQMHGQYPVWLLRLIGSFVIRVDDINRSYLLDFSCRRFVPSKDPNWNIQVNSQPLLFAFETTYGMQTLSISGRFWLRRKHKRFILLRILMALRNAEIYLRPKHLVEPRFRRFAWSNRERLRHQFYGWFGIIKSFVR